LEARAERVGIADGRRGVANANRNACRHFAEPAHRSRIDATVSGERVDQHRREHDDVARCAGIEAFLHRTDGTEGRAETRAGLALEIGCKRFHDAFGGARAQEMHGY